MSEPRFRRVNAGSGHSYRLDGHHVPGVTTVIGVLDKPALVDWAARVTAEYAIDHWAHLSAMQPIPRFEELKQARFRTTKKAADQGHRIHAMAERIAHGETVEVPPEIELQVDAYARFLDRWDIETLVTEAPVCHLGYRYAGTLDMLCTIPRLGTVLLDIKTGKSVYDDHALQQAAYRHADVMLREVPQTGPRGGRKPSLWVEEPLPHIDAVLIAHVTGDTVDLLPVRADDTVFDVFLYCLELYETWIKRTSWKHRDDPRFDPTIGQPIYPETPTDTEGWPLQ